MLSQRRFEKDNDFSNIYIYIATLHHAHISSCNSLRPVRRLQFSLTKHIEHCKFFQAFSGRRQPNYCFILHNKNRPRKDSDNGVDCEFYNCIMVIWLQI